jgi:hypothetical protein
LTTNAVPSRVEHISYRYRNRQELALRDISFDLRTGEVLLATGASGCARSRLSAFLVEDQVRFFGDTAGFKQAVDYREVKLPARLIMEQVARNPTPPLPSLPWDRMTPPFPPFARGEWGVCGAATAFHARAAVNRIPGRFLRLRGKRACAARYQPQDRRGRCDCAAGSEWRSLLPLSSRRVRVSDNFGSPSSSLPAGRTSNWHSAGPSHRGVTVRALLTQEYMFVILSRQSLLSAPRCAWSIPFCTFFHLLNAIAASSEEVIP